MTASDRRPAGCGQGATRRCALTAALAATVMWLLAACSSVPTSGPIEQGPVVDSTETTQFIRVIAAPPSAGASPQEVVRGFLEASASLENDHAIARRYLTEEASTSWAPGHRTTVYALSSLKVTGSGSEVVVTVNVTGELLDDGRLETVDPAKQRRIELHMQRVPQEERNLPAEWRIAEPPDELLISDSDLRRAFREQQVYFLADSTQTLVPDARLLPVVGPGLPTAVAERVLAGPSQWLAPSVGRSIPEGTALALGSVPVTDGIAMVELTDQAMAGTQPQRRALAAELTWSLTELPDVRAVEVLVAGSPYQVAGLPVLLDRDTWLTVAPDHVMLGPAGTDRPPAFVLADKHVERITDMGETSIPLPATVQGHLSGLAVSYDERRASLVDRDRGVLWLFSFDNRSSPRQFAATTDASGSFAPDGSFWFASGGSVHRVDGGAGTASISVSAGSAEGAASDDARGLDPRSIDAVRVARDGVRIAVVSEGRLLLGVIERAADGTVTITSLHPVVGELRQVRDVSWRTATDLDVLGSLARTGRQLVRVGVGSGTAQGLRAPTAPTDVTAAPAATTLAVAADRFVYGNVGLQWRQQRAGQSAAYSG